MDCTQTLNNSLKLTVSDGIDETSFSWLYLDPVTGAIGEVGNSAIEFDPISYDFGFARTSSDRLTEVFTATNTAFTDVFITGFSITGTHYSISSNTCPTAPQKFERGDDCTLVVQSAPTAAGNLGTNVEVSYYADGNEEDTFESILGLSGTGVSNLVFDGVKTRSNLVHNAVTLNWDQTNDAATFVAFQIGAGSTQIFDSTVINTSGTVTSMDISGLTPGTAYTYQVKATDVFGNFDSNTATISFTTDANRLPVPTSASGLSLYSGEYTSTLDVYDSNTNNDTDIDGDIITYSCSYTRSDDATQRDCTTLVNESGGNAAFNTSTGILSNWQSEHDDIGVTFNVTITATDPYNGAGSVARSATVIQGVPDAPTISGITPNVAANNNNPVVSGTGTPNLAVNLYSGAGCANLIGSGTAAGDGSFSIATTVNDDESITIRGRTVNAIGNPSDCSATSVSYVEDSTAPTPFLVSGTSPESPADSITPAVVGTAEAGATISLYSNNSCTGAALNTAVAAGDGSYSVTFNATAEGDTTVWVVATDAAGNSTSCSGSQVDYTNYSIATGIGYFTGAETDSSVQPTYQMNPDAATNLRFTSSAYDSTYFAHSPASNPYEVTFKTAGDYYIAFNIPLEYLGTERPAIRVEAFLEGTAIKGAISESTYIRDAGGHSESSAHFSLMVPNVNVDDVLTISVVETAGLDNGDLEVLTVSSSAEYSLYAEYLNPASREYFYGIAQPGEFNNTSRELEWSIDNEFTAGTYGYSTTVDPQEITLQQAGSYLLNVTLPVESAAQRASVKVKAMISTDGGSNFSEITSIKAMQGYIRSLNDHNNSSVHFAGIIPNVGANDIIKIVTEREAASGSVNLTSGKFASIFIDKIDTSSNVFFAYDKEAAGYNWNQDSSTEINWDTPTFTEANYSLAGDEQQIDITAGGDYLLIYNNTFTTTVERGAPKITVWLNGNEIKDSELKTHYIRSGSGHNESSGSMVYLLRDIPDNSYITIATMREANSGTVTKIDNAQLVLIKK